MKIKFFIVFYNMFFGNKIVFEFEFVYLFFVLFDLLGLFIF